MSHAGLAEDFGTSLSGGGCGGGTGDFEARDDAIEDCHLGDKR